MNNLQDQTMKKIYNDALSKIEATDKLKKELIEVFEQNLSKRREIYFIRKVAAIAACILLFVIITNFSTIKAGIVSLYERFIINAESEYILETEEYIVDVNKSVQLLDGTEIIINQCVLTENGIDIKLSQESNSKFELVGCEINIESSGKSYDFQQEMFSRFNIGYICSNIYAGEKNFEIEQLLNKKSDVTMTLLYENMDDGEELFEKNVKFKIEFLKIYPIKSVILTDNKELENIYFKINKIVINSWYMKVEYEEKQAISESQWLILRLSENDKAFMLLSSEEDEGKYISYYEIPNESKNLKIVPELVDIQNQAKENINLDDGIEIKLDEIFREDR